MIFSYSGESTFQFCMTKKVLNLTYERGVTGTMNESAKANSTLGHSFAH